MAFDRPPAKDAQIGGYRNALVNGRFVFSAFTITGDLNDAAGINALFFRLSEELYGQTSSLQQEEIYQVDHANLHDFLIGWYDHSTGCGGYATVWLASNTGAPHQAFGVVLRSNDGTQQSGVPDTVIFWTNPDGTTIRLEVDVNKSNPPKFFYRLTASDTLG